MGHPLGVIGLGSVGWRACGRCRIDREFAVGRVGRRLGRLLRRGLRSGLLMRGLRVPIRGTSRRARRGGRRLLLFVVRGRGARWLCCRPVVCGGRSHAGVERSGCRIAVRGSRVGSRAAVVGGACVSSSAWGWLGVANAERRYCCTHGVVMASLPGELPIRGLTLARSPSLGVRSLRVRRCRRLQLRGGSRSRPSSWRGCPVGRTRSSETDRCEGRRPGAR